MLDLAIVGAPKSGTSSLFYWLVSHPEFQGSKPKETFFFMDADHPLYRRHGLSYLEDGLSAFNTFFPASGVEAKRVEATTHHLYQSTARESLSGMNPTPLVVAVLREPARRILSSFLYTMNNKAAIKTDLTFDRYVETLLEGAEEELGRFYLAEDALYVAQRELELSDYVRWLRWWKECLPSDRMEIVLFEELISDPKLVTKRLCSRLGVDTAFYDEFAFEAHNSTLSRAPLLVDNYLLRLANRTPIGVLREGFRSFLLKRQVRRGLQPQQSEAGLDALQEYFRSTNGDLANSYKLELDEWWS